MTDETSQQIKEENEEVIQKVREHNENIGRGPEKKPQKITSLQDLSPKERTRNLIVSIGDEEWELTVHAVPYRIMRPHLEELDDISTQIAKEETKEIQFSRTRDGAINPNDTKTREQYIEAQERIEQRKMPYRRKVAYYYFIYGYLQPEGLVDEIEIEGTIDENIDEKMEWLDENIYGGAWTEIAQKIAAFSNVDSDAVFFSHSR